MWGSRIHGCISDEPTTCCWFELVGDKCDSDQQWGDEPRSGFWNAGQRTRHQAHHAFHENFSNSVLMLSHANAIHSSSRHTSSLTNHFSGTLESYPQALGHGHRPFTVASDRCAGLTWKSMSRYVYNCMPPLHLKCMSVQWFKKHNISISCTSKVKIGSYMTCGSGTTPKFSSIQILEKFTCHHGRTKMGGFKRWSHLFFGMFFQCGSYFRYLEVDKV